MEVVAKLAQHAADDCPPGLILRPVCASPEQPVLPLFCLTRPHQRAPLQPGLVLDSHDRSACHTAPLFGMLHSSFVT